MDPRELLACPLCSQPPHFLSRPIVVCGAASRVWFLVGGTHCHHLDTYASANRAEDGPEALIARWNGWVAQKASERSQRSGHTPEQAARWLDALSPKTYAIHNSH